MTSWAPKGCSYSICRLTQRGTPQGGVISPFLWLLVVNDLLMKLEREHISAVAYADDVFVIIKGKFVNTLTNLMSSTIEDMKACANSRGLNVKASKMELVLFTNKQKRKLVPDGIELKLVKVGGQEIDFSDSAKYLGIILDKKLNWTPNVEERIRKAKVAWYICKSCIGKKWGLQPRITHWIYTTVVRPSLSYGALVWWHSLKKITLASKLQKLQR
ncbi:reverse transcriptase domain-containing protein, partial [Streptomyces sp. IBSBF 2390]|uniref:reverse transcriptase domain-containing protein n=1 Tax=Streptomyces sp. IBSBF 2390 TaxID=2903533 RepID=UPI002FDBA9B9